MAYLAVVTSSMAVSMGSVNVCGGRATFSSTISSVRMASTASFAAPPLRASRVVAMAAPQGTQSSSLDEAIAHAIEEANEVCSVDETSGNCAAAWDEVEELASTAAHRKVSDMDNLKQDPLEEFCKEVPEADECRVYED